MNEESERYTNMATRQQQLEAFDRLLTVMDNLREHCPWDRKQTFDSLRENTIEETYELSSAITHHNMNEIKKEEQGKVTFKTDALRKYFPKSYTSKQMEDKIIQLLEQWQKRREKSMER